MKELEVKIVNSTPGFMPNLKVRAFQMELGDSSDDFDGEQGITREEFYSILDKASQPKPDSEKSERWK